MRPFTFTETESNRLEELSWRIHGLVTLQRPGWRVEIVQAVIQLRRLIHRAVMRG